MCGKGALSTLRVMRHGLSVTEMAVSAMPGKPTGVWSIKENNDSQFDTYMVVSFANATLVLSIGDKV
jgi:splicing factor 3B subunit 3